jgi:hypothetical protein
VSVLKDKYLCIECIWVGKDGEYLTAPNPFEPESVIVGCPKCRQVDTLVTACAQDGCCRSATIGAPNESGYSWLCHEHGRRLL